MFSKALGQQKKKGFFEIRLQLLLKSVLYTDLHYSNVEKAFGGD